MPKHNSKCNKVMKLYKKLEKIGFEIEPTKNGVKVRHIESNKFYIFHYSNKGYHPLRRWIKSNFNIDI